MVYIGTMKGGSMFINEVEHLVGLSKKSIRYYEKEGLLFPKRNKENDYRVYNDEDIKKLRIIRFLRELGISINDLKKLSNNEITLQEIMLDNIIRIEDVSLKVFNSLRRKNDIHKQ